MKVLSIKQPWMGAIECGMKFVDIRTWQTHYRGEILLHASKEYSFVGEQAIGPERMRLIQQHGVRKGGIVAKTNLVEVIEYHEQLFKEHEPAHLIPGSWWDRYKGKRVFGWVFEHIQPLKWVPASGQLGLWDFDLR
jgi:hypothetical protein